MTMTKKINKIASLVAIAICLSLSNVNSAKALMIDPAVISSKVSGFINKIQETVSKVQGYIQQGIQMKAQLGDLEGLKKWALSQALELGKSEMVIQATKEKEKQEITARQDNYVTAKNEYYDAKIQILNQNMEEIKAREEDARQELRDVTQKITRTQQEYNNMQNNPEKAAQLQDELAKLTMRKQELEAILEEYSRQKQALTRQKGKMQDEKNKVGGSEDAEYQMFNLQLDEINKSKDPKFVSKIDDVNDADIWGDDDTVKKFTPVEQDYKDFIERYFYDPDEINASNASKEQGRVEHQGKIDEVTRQRRYLLTNSAAHLMQVASTLRREIPDRTEKLDAMFQQTPSATGEVEAVTSYTATRVENMKALLMYAKLQSAKLQYQAVRELLDLEMEKKYNTQGGSCKYEDFCLTKYILTEEEIKDFVEKANQANTNGEDGTTKNWGFMEERE